MLIDDFTTGPHTVTLNGGADLSYQSITTDPAFPVRNTRFYVAGPASSQPVTLDVGSPQLLTIGTGPHVYHRLEVAYGYQTNGNGSPLGQDLSRFTGFRVNFDFNDLSLNFNIVFFSNSGGTWSEAGKNIVAGFTPFTVELAFAEFVGAAQSSNVDFIVLVAQSGTFGGGNDYKINSFEVY